MNILIIICNISKKTYLLIFKLFYTDEILPNETYNNKQYIVFKMSWSIELSDLLLLQSSTKLYRDHYLHSNTWTDEVCMTQKLSLMHHGPMRRTPKSIFWCIRDDRSMNATNCKSNLPCNRLNHLNLSYPGVTLLSAAVRCCNVSTYCAQLSFERSHESKVHILI